MTIATEITRLQTAKTAIATAIGAKGVTVPPTTHFDGYAALVDQISSGGGSSGTPLEWSEAYWQNILDNAWTRPADWLTLPTVGDTDQKFVGLVAVFPESSFLALTAAGDYTIDWGDGTVENIATGAQANHLYDFNDADLDGTNAPVTLTDSGDLVTRTAHGYSDGMEVRFYNIVTTTGLIEGQVYYVINATANTFQVSATVGGAAIALTGDGSATLLPYKQAIVTVTPQAGQNLTALNLNVKNSTSGLQTYDAGWLDLIVGSPNFTSTGLVLAANSTARNVRFAFLEQVSIKNLGNTTDLSYRFYYMYKLRSVSLPNTAAVTSMSSMFSGCTSLQSVPLFNTQAVTSMSYMFYYCNSLQTVPLFNIQAVTSMSNMFYNCYSLQTVPLFNIKTTGTVDMSGMFYSCYSLQSVPLFNIKTTGTVDMSYMFQNCYSLQTVPLFNTAAVTSMSGMFSGCTSLQSVPLFNTQAVTSMSYMFRNCTSLQTVPLFNTQAVTSMSSMFQNCYSLQSVPLFNTQAVTSMSNMFYNCYSLQSMPALNVSAVTSSTNFNLMFSSCNNLARIQAKEFKYTFSVDSCKLSAAALNEIYTNLPTVTGQTLTVMGNWGTATDNPSIATAKGWTVTG